MISVASVEDLTPDAAGGAPARLVLWARHSHGVTGAVSADCTLEVMLHRNVLNAFVPLNDTSTVESDFQLALSRVDDPVVSTGISILSQFLEHPPLVALSSSVTRFDDWVTQYRHTGSALRRALPQQPPIHLMSFEERWMSGQPILRLRLAWLGQDGHSSFRQPGGEPLVLNVSAYLEGFTVSAWQERSLSGALPKATADATRLRWAVNSPDAAEEAVSDVTLQEVGSRVQGMKSDAHAISQAADEWQTGPVIVTLHETMEVATLHLRT